MLRAVSDVLFELRDGCELGSADYDAIEEVIDAVHDAMRFGFPETVTLLWSNRGDPTAAPVLVGVYGDTQRATSEARSYRAVQPAARLYSNTEPVRA